jgi:hypothetical protein
MRPLFPIALVLCLSAPALAGGYGGMQQSIGFAPGYGVGQSFAPVGGTCGNVGAAFAPVGGYGTCGNVGAAFVPQQQVVSGYSMQQAFVPQQQVLVQQAPVYVNRSFAVGSGLGYGGIQQAVVLPQAGVGYGLNQSFAPAFVGGGGRFRGVQRFRQGRNGRFRGVQRLRGRRF